MVLENRILDLGLVEYSRALKFQNELFLEVKNGSLKSALVFCRHFPVVTLGRQAKKSNLKVTDTVLSSQGISVQTVDRGGDITYHGPGQLLIYPIIHLDVFRKDLHYFLRKLEDTVIQVLSDFGINARARSGLTGVWVGERKISSIGIGVKNWISYHGLSLNIKEEDLENFSLIRPCGMDIAMCSMETVLKQKVEFEDVKNTFIRRFGYA